MKSKTQKSNALATIPSGGEPSPIVALDALARDGFKFVRDLKLADGQGVKGIFRGEGGVSSFTDDKTGEVREVPSYLIEVGNVTYRVVAGAKLARLLAGGKLGAEVAIYRIGNVEIGGGRRMTDWAVGWKA